MKVPGKLGACARCSGVFGPRPYASIPGVGLFCLGCHKWWLNERDQEGLKTSCSDEVVVGVNVQVFHDSESPEQFAHFGKQCGEFVEGLKTKLFVGETT